MMDPGVVESKIKVYESFVEETLKKDLSEIEQALSVRVQKHKEWEEVKQIAKTLKEFNEKNRDMLLRVPLSSGISIHGEVSDFERTYIDVGLGYILEMDCDEADKYAEIRMRSLQRDIEHYRKLAVNVKVNIKMVLLAISELQAITVNKTR